MKLVFISDTHLRHGFVIPEGDILIHSGDLTMSGSVPEVSKAVKWLENVALDKEFSSIVVIPGNHDWLAEKDPQLMKKMMEDAGLIFLNHESAIVDGIRFFGSGYTPRFYDWALNVDRGEEIARLWSQIPDDTQILVTHGPPYGKLDEVPIRGEWEEWALGNKEHVGCWDLAHRIKKLKDLKIHSFGHIHRPGVVYGADGVIYVNASTCNEEYEAAHTPIILDFGGINDRK